jgi:acetyl-CoA carboxylase biotin carboxylase subunit
MENVIYKSIQAILIANRGEIASRIIRTCKKMGIKTIAVYSDADRHALFVKEADMAVFIGDSNPTTSYLDKEKIIRVAKQTNADAIHPGYGFLSENAEFAKLCAENELIFIGPNVNAVISMGSKSKAKTIMQAHNVPVVPGYQGSAQDIDTLKEAAIKIGFPVLLKATAGGGGKGMRIVFNENEIISAIESAKREALSAFGNDELIIEKYIASGRHIEFQIFGDKHGNVIHILERECTIQRRYQKIFEESPSPIMSEKLRNEMGEAAINAAKALQYDNAGTVEFIFDDVSQSFYFLEVNTRLQVEHPVTELITGLDLVQMQIESAEGQVLNIQQKNIFHKGYAIEARLYAEDAENNFLPVTGTIEKFEIPDIEGLRIDSAVKSGSEISVFYDPMIAKLIVWGKNRHEAHRKLRYSLSKMICLGTKTNQQFLQTIANNENFKAGKYNTHFIDNENLLSLNILENEQYFACIACTIFAWHKRNTNLKLLKNVTSGWRNNFYDYQKESYILNKNEIEVKYRFLKNMFKVFVNENLFDVTLINCDKNVLQLEINKTQFTFTIIQKENKFFIHHQNIGNIELERKEKFPVKEKEKIKGGFTAPMPSQVVKVLVKENEKINIGDALIILSSMKMENTIYADVEGIVEEIFAKEGTNVESGFLLLKIKEEN